MRILDSERISSHFTSPWAGKLIVAVDESLIDTDKPTVTNRLKMIATNPTIPLEGKGKDAKEVPNISKLIMCSNDESNFMKIDKIAFVSSRYHRFLRKKTILAWQTRWRRKYLRFYIF